LVPSAIDGTAVGTGDATDASCPTKSAAVPGGQAIKV
jgi:hypothetical protein